MRSCRRILSVASQPTTHYAEEAPVHRVTVGAFWIDRTPVTNAALYDGVEDARTGRAPYLLTIASKPAERGGGLREGLISTARVILLGLCMDAVCQFIEFDAFHPAEAVIIALLLAFVPYLLLRGPCARIARWWYGAASANGIQ
jgi:hypothetical protein